MRGVDYPSTPNPKPYIPILGPTLDYSHLLKQPQQLIQELRRANDQIKQLQDMASNEAEVARFLKYRLRVRGWYMLRVRGWYIMVPLRVFWGIQGMAENQMEKKVEN